MAEQVKAIRQQAAVSEVVRIFREVASQPYILEIDFTFHGDRESLGECTYTVRRLVMPEDPDK